MGFNSIFPSFRALEVEYISATVARQDVINKVFSVLVHGRTGAQEVRKAINIEIINVLFMALLISLFDIQALPHIQQVA